MNCKCGILIEDCAQCAASKPVESPDQQEATPPVVVPDSKALATPKRAMFERYDADLDQLCRDAGTAIFKIEEYLTEQYGIQPGMGYRRSLFGIRSTLCEQQTWLQAATREWLDEREKPPEEPKPVLDLMEALKKSLAEAKANGKARKSGRAEAPANNPATDLDQNKRDLL